MKTSIHAMTSEQASEKKKNGHIREEIRLSQLPEGSEIITGTGKADIKRNDGKTESVKGGKKTQWALYTLDRTLTDDFFNNNEKQAFIEWVNFIPDSKEEWLKDRMFYSKNPNVSKLYDQFKDNPMRLVDYFCGTSIVDYLVILDGRNNRWMEKEMVEFRDKIKDNIKEVYTTPGGKLVFKGGDKNTILFELELRKGKNSHKRILFHSLLHRVIDSIK